jgi:hypothetical protein
MTIALAILCVILIVFIFRLLFQLNKRTAEKEKLEKAERRSWLLKVALEQSCKLPTVEAEELAKIEPQINELMNGSLKDKELEEKMRELIMSLYEEKVAKEPPKAKKK